MCDCCDYWIKKIETIREQIVDAKDDSIISVTELTVQGDNHGATLSAGMAQAYDGTLDIVSPVLKHAHTPCTPL